MMTGEDHQRPVAGESADSDADSLRAKALEMLDFPAVRRKLAGNTLYPPARRLAETLSPEYDGPAVQWLQRETTEGITFIAEAGDIGLHAGDDVSPALARSSLGGTLTGLELLAVAESLDAQRRVRLSLLRFRDRLPVLAGLAGTIPDLNEGLSRIRACVDLRGEVLDDATPALRALRRAVRDAYRHIAEALERVMQSSAGQEALQDQVISMRGERLVLQVKAEMRHRVPGIVHDASNTGATLFVEPLATVELCNAWREAALEEERETQLVLRDLSTWVASVAADVEQGVQTTARIEFILARARYSASMMGVDPGLPAQAEARSPAGSDGEVRLLEATHPLLGLDAVPLSLVIGPDWTVLVVTGPNTGGKTVAMKTLGLLAVMHQAGLRVPAREGSRLPVFDGIYADVGDEQSVQRSVSTFGSHMRNVIHILRCATTSSLVLLDELGTSTDPEEGSALAKAILGHLAGKGVATVVTTHHRAVAAHAAGTPGMMNASVELDPDTLRPTYQLTLGVPGRSYAMSVADQLGLPREIAEEARSLLEPQYLRFEDWLRELQDERHQLKKLIEETESARAQAESRQGELDAKLEELEAQREDIRHSLRKELTAQYEDARKKLRRVEASLSWGGTSADVKAATKDLSAAGQEIRELERRPPDEPQSPGQRPLAVGDAVDCLGLGARGTVVAVHRQSEEAEVAIGSVRLRLSVRRLSRAQEPVPDAPDRSDVGLDLEVRDPSQKLDLRGMRAQDALIEVDRFLDQALRDGLSSVQIVHGKGTGALRLAVREFLDRHPLAKSHAPEPAERGGNGATLVELT